jgi:cobalt-precorrin 5A hydrolase/precorrin-3B C17-methyltransferase
MHKCFREFQPLSAIALTQLTAEKIQPLCEHIGINLWTPETVKIKSAQNYSGTLKEHLSQIWAQNHALIFCIATGAVIRLIAPLLKQKQTDPAIIVIDFPGNKIISLCGAHQRNADLLTQLIAHQLNATPIITGSSYSLGLSGIDILGTPYGWVKGEGDWTEVSASIARGEQVAVIQGCGSTLWQDSLPSSHTFNFNNVVTVFSQDLNNQKSEIPQTQHQALVWISEQKAKRSHFKIPIAQWHPRVLWVGIGCERDTSESLIESAINQVLTQKNFAIEAIAGIATIELKQNEPGIINLTQKWNLPLITFTVEELDHIETPNPSTLVKQKVGSKSVAEAAAIRAANLLSPREVGEKQTLLIPKQVIKQPGHKGAVTLALAQSIREYTGKKGQIYLIGIGPGSMEHITPGAKTAITQADVVIGYNLYLEMISTLFRPGQIIEPYLITQEIQRAQRAISLAKWGLTVAVVSSGDCGIYAMGGLVLEQLVNQGWDGDSPQIEVFPGITAMQAAAAKLGAPLMHDFCAISLSDLLTPWEVIKKRLTAAASADFVTAIYNPKSSTRTEPIVSTQAIFLRYREPHTPVAIANSVTREQEQIITTTLEKMLNYEINMLSLIIIGNSSTKEYHNWLITPRGYQI